MAGSKANTRSIVKDAVACPRRSETTFVWTPAHEAMRPKLFGGR